MTEWREPCGLGHERTDTHGECHFGTHTHTHTHWAPGNTNIYSNREWWPSQVSTHTHEPLSTWFLHHNPPWPRCTPTKDRARGSTGVEGNMTLNDKCLQIKVVHSDCANTPWLVVGLGVSHTHSLHGITQQ